MKRFVILNIVLWLGITPLFSYQPIVEPDLSYLPSLLDSTIQYSYDTLTGEWNVVDRRAYTYDENGVHTFKGKPI